MCVVSCLRLSSSAFQPFLQGKATECVMEQSQARVAQEALLTPVRDAGQSELLRGRFMGTQPFEKGLGFSHQDAHKAQVRSIDSSGLFGFIQNLVFLLTDAKCYTSLLFFAERRASRFHQ